MTVACPQCDKSFYEISTRNRHVRSVHENHRDHTCQVEVCKYAAQSANKLQQTVLTTHSNENDNECGAAFKLAGKLTRHTNKTKTYV